MSKEPASSGVVARARAHCAVSKKLTVSLAPSNETPGPVGQGGTFGA